MIKYIDQNCPLCDRPSKYYLVDRGNRKYFNCEYCTYFQVYIHAEELLNAANQHWKDDASKASHNSDDNKVLFITVKDSPDGGDKLLRGEFHDRAMLPEK